MSSNSRKTARLLSLKKKVQERRAATGGPKGDFYSIGNVVKDEYGALFMIERYQNGKWIVVALGPKSNDKKNPYQKVIRKEIVVPREEMTYAIKNVSDAEMVSLVVSQQGIPAAQVELVTLKEFQEDCEIAKEASKEGTPEKDAEETPSVVDVSEESAEEPPSLNSQFAAFKTEVAEALGDQIKELFEPVQEVVGALDARVGPDAGDRFADEFRLMGTLMDVVSEYKYLGLILHESLGRRTGPGSGLAYGAEKEKYLYKRLLDNDEERVIVDIFEDDSVSRRQLVAKTRLLVDNKPAPGEEHVQFYHVSETLDEVISAYRAANPKVKQTDYVHLRAWDLQRRSIRDAIVKRTGYCRRVGCYPHSLETTVGKLVAQTMTDATSILNCEVWQMGHPETDIEAALLKIYRTLLGVEAKTAR